MQTVEKLTNKETSLKWSKDVIHNGFIALEKELLSTAGKYCFGDSITFADICLVPQVYNAKRFNVNLSEFPTISRIYEALVELPEFISASPEKQPDAQ
jgi:maleylacetoacetate isomerase